MSDTEGRQNLSWQVIPNQREIKLPAIRKILKRSLKEAIHVDTWKARQT